MNNQQTTNKNQVSGRKKRRFDDEVTRKEKLTEGKREDKRGQRNATGEGEGTGTRKGSEEGKQAASN